jgi:serine/threonine-protein kinase HipA
MMPGFKHQLNAYLGEKWIATLALTDDDQLQFFYTDEWRHEGYPVSPHLPLDNSASTDQYAIKVFFQNLFPEGENLDVLLQNCHLSRYNIFGLTRALGADLPGALQLLPETVSLPNTQTFRLIQTSEIVERLKHYSASNLLIWDGKPRLSLAGVHQKINVVLDIEGQMGFGDGKLCSTHLLKFERSAEQHLVLNEFLMMKLAKSLEMNVADVELKYFDKFPTLLVTRFDRKWINDAVHRRHMIDGCQALNLLPDYKYERNLGSGRDVRDIREGASLPALFALSHSCHNPALAKKQLLEWTLFNLIIGNWDAHAKNLSYFLSNAGMEMTPAYDLISIRVYTEFDQELSMALGDEFDATQIHAYQLADFADSCGISRASLAKMLSHLCAKILIKLPELQALAGTADEQLFIKNLIDSIRQQAHYLQTQAPLISNIFASQGAKRV